MPRWLIAIFVTSLSAQRFNSSFYHRNVWQFPPTELSLSVEHVVTSPDGKVFAGAGDGLYRLIWNQFVPVPGLPRQRVVALQRLPSGEIAVFYRGQAFSTNGLSHRPLSSMPATPPQRGDIVWDDFKIHIEPKKQISVRRKSDGKLLAQSLQLPVDSSLYWSPATPGKAFFLINDTWILMDARTATYELLQFVLPHNVLGLYLDPGNFKLYLALGPKGLGIASIEPISGSWEIPNESSVIQLLNGRPAVMQARGASLLTPTPQPWPSSATLNASPVRPPEAMLDLPETRFTDLQQILITAKGTTYAIPRLEFPKIKQRNKWSEVPYHQSEITPLPIRWLAQANDETLWAAAKHGPLRIRDPDSSSPRLERLNSDYVSEFRVDPENRLWLVGEGHLAFYESGRWSKVALPDCVLSPKIRSLAIRNRNEYWLAYRNGAPVTRVLLGPTPTCFHYGKEQGNRNEETNHVAFDRDGWLWMLGSVATVVLTQPDRVDKALVLPHYVYFPSGSGHWHGFVDEPAEADILVGRYLTRIRRSFVKSLAALEPEVTLEPHGSIAFRFESRVSLPPEISYSIYWRWISKEGSAISEFAPLRIIQKESRPLNAAAIEVISPAGNRVIPYPESSPVPAALACLAGLLMLGLTGYRYRWHIRLLWNSPSNRQAVERALFLKLRSKVPESRENEILSFPTSIRPALRAMLEQFESFSDGEDDRTRSGVILDRKYLLEHVIAKGGFSTVYLAQDIEAGSSVAIKVFQQSARIGTWLAKRLELEIEAMRRIDHPGVVKLIHHATTPDARPFLVMDFIQGVTLRQLLRQGPISQDRGLKIIRQICSALLAVHSEGILHRDLKPENIMIKQAGAPNEMAMLIDFGVATVYEEILDGRQSTFFAGSLDYSAPEQVAGLKLETSDVYSLGVLAFEILTGDRFKQVIGAAGGLGPIEAALRKSGWDSQATGLAELLSDSTKVEHSLRIKTVRRFLERLPA